ncbi:MAG: hypothetical protein ACLTZE_06895 [Evtepia sp.]
MKLSKDEKAKVVTCCNERLITDYSFDPDFEYPNQWFIRQFDFISDESVREQLGDAFYQARFLCAMMESLSLPMGKNKGVIKFQIIQYASICEALLNYTLELYFKEEFESVHAGDTYSPNSSAVSSKTKITHDGQELYLCLKKSEKAKITWTSNPKKAEFALKKGIISNDVCNDYCNLYELRNHTHILKAARANYYPKPKEAKDAYKLVFKFLNEIKQFFQITPLPMS